LLKTKRSVQTEICVSLHTFTADILVKQCVMLEVTNLRKNLIPKTFNFFYYEHTR